MTGIKGGRRGRQGYGERVIERGFGLDASMLMALATSGSERHACMTCLAKLGNDSFYIYAKYSKAFLYSYTQWHRCLEPLSYLLHCGWPVLCDLVGQFNSLRPQEESRIG